MAAPNKQPKVMSSRLAGMKFMQRASASSPSSPSTPSEPPSKKQRLSHGSTVRSPVTPLDNSPATGKQDKSETKWYLSFKTPQVQTTSSPLRIVSAGFSTLDTAGYDDDAPPANGTEQTKPMVAGRKSFGDFGKQKQDEDSSDEDDDEGHDNDSTEGLEDDPTGVQALINQGKREASDRARAERKATKAAAKAEAQRLAEQRRKKEVNLNKVTSISSGGGGGGGSKKSSSEYLSNMICHKCKQKGHMIKDCPQRGGQRR